MAVRSVLVKPDESVLVNAVQENLFALFRSMANSLAGGEVIETEGISYTIPFRATRCSVDPGRFA